MKQKKFINSIKTRVPKENHITRRWVICNIVVHRASYTKHIRTKSLLEKENQNSENKVKKT